MRDIILYFIRGMNHYIFLLYEMFDFKEFGTIFFLFVFFLAIFIFFKDIRSQIIDLTLTIFSLLKTKIGIIFVLVLVLYYTYIAFTFEESINTVVLISSIYLFFESFTKTNLNLTSDSDNSVFESIVEFSFPVVLLCVQQIVIIIENGSFNNFLPILLSLLIIPIYSTVFVLFKNYMCFDTFYNKNQLERRVNKYEFYKTYTLAAFCFFNYKDADTYLEKILNSMQDFIINSEQMRNRIDNEVNFNFDFKPHFRTIKRKSKSKVYKLFHYVWLIDIFFILYEICNLRFLKVSLNFSYYLTLGVLIIYLIYDLMKIQTIQNQYDFVLYLLFYIFFSFILVTYSLTLQQFRLTEIAFIVPFFIVTRVRASFYNPINFLSLPFLSKQNFFGLDSSKYDEHGNRIK
ncbi:hypothetical protein ERUR111494_09080 [Erysipelothrix urinaevulpis]